MVLARWCASRKASFAMSSSDCRARLCPCAHRRELHELANSPRVKLDPKQRHTIEAVVDRLIIDEKIRIRLSDSIETALTWGEARW